MNLSNLLCNVSMLLAPTTRPPRLFHSPNTLLLNSFWQCLRWIWTHPTWNQSHVSCLALVQPEAYWQTLYWSLSSICKPRTGLLATFAFLERGGKKIVRPHSIFILSLSFFLILASFFALSISCHSYTCFTPFTFNFIFFFIYFTFLAFILPHSVFIFLFIDVLLLIYLYFPSLCFPFHYSFLLLPHSSPSFSFILSSFFS